MVGARVNGKLVKVDYKIQNGDRIEILTSQNSRGPSRDWLGIVKSTQAKNKINQWFKKEFKESNIIKGKEMIASYCKAKSINLSNIMNPKYQDVVQKKYGFKVHTAYIAEVKRSLGMTMYDAPNAVEELNQPRKHPLKEKVEAIKGCS